MTKHTLCRHQGSAKQITVGQARWKKGTREVSKACVETLEERRMLSATMVKDINAVVDVEAISSAPDLLTVVNGTAYFVADDGVHGRELWKTDGTATGTVMVKDINVGPDGSGPASLTNVNGVVFFTAIDKVYGRELWKTDGTDGGTMAVKDITPGTVYDPFKDADVPYDSDPRELTNVNGVLYFTANDWEHGYQLWKSNGTEAGTAMVKLLDAVDTQGGPRGLTAVGSTLYYVVDDWINGEELWKSNGTAAGTMMVKDIYEGSDFSSPSNLTNVNGTLFFSAIDATHGRELWKSNGTAAGTVLVKDIGPAQDIDEWGNPVVHSSEPRNLANANGVLYFTAEGGQLWKSDGTAAGTVLVSSAADTGVALPQIMWANGSVFFSAYDASHGQELWTTNGTAAATRVVKDINPGIYTDPIDGSQSPASSMPGNLTIFDGKLYFTAYDSDHGRRLWKTDGTEAGTVAVVDGLDAGDAESGSNKMVVLNGRLLLAAYDGTHGIELYSSDGTAAGTALVKDIRPGFLTFPSMPGEIVNVNGTAYFAADDGVHGLELWKSDGTPGGTVMVKDIVAGPLESLPRDLTSVNGTLFFTIWNAEGLKQLWKSDGTEAGTVMVKDVLLRQYGSISALTNINGTLYFATVDTDDNHGLWKSDGTVDGTQPIVYLSTYEDSISVSLEAIVALANGTIVFTAYTGMGECQVWRTDGTGEGTAWLRTISISRQMTEGPSLLAVGNTAYFMADDGIHGEELWKTDGTANGTVIVKDIRVNALGLGSYPTYLTNINGTLFFSAIDQTHGRELWKSDGTAAGTLMVKDINAGADLSSDAEWLANVNGTLFFAAMDDEHGMELWKSDGTEAGTVLVKDIANGSESSWPIELTEVNGVVAFVATDTDHGRELWQSDGTASGTVLAGNIGPGNTNSDLGGLRNVNGALFFSADDGTHGQELWRFVPSTGPVTGSFTLQLDPTGSQVQVIDPATGSVLRTVSLSSTEPLVLSGSSDDDKLTLDLVNGVPLPAGGVSFDGGAGINVVAIRGMSVSNSLTVSAAQVLIGSGKLTFARADVQLHKPGGGLMELGGLSIAAGGKVALPAGGSRVLRVGTLSMAGDAVLELADNDLVVKSGDIAGLSNLVKSARADGAWSGSGIMSSAAKADARGMTGLAVAANGNGEIVVKYTWNGDANLDGIVNADDYFLIDSGYITQAKGWANGDLNYDGIINADDYFLIDSAYTGQSGVLAVQEIEDVGVFQGSRKIEEEMRSVVEELLG